MPIASLSHACHICTGLNALFSSLIARQRLNCHSIAVAHLPQILNTKVTFESNEHTLQTYREKYASRSISNYMYIVIARTWCKLVFMALLIYLAIRNIIFLCEFSDPSSH